MLKVLVLLVLLSTAFATDDYKTFDFCSINCGESGAKHSACDCSNKSPRKEILTEPSLIEFRTRVLDEHNKWRDYVAAGNENVTYGLPKATNMMLMNYDMECEHIARCRAINSFQHKESDKTGHDKCRLSTKSKHMGQNLYGLNIYLINYMLDFNSTKHWYQEISLVTLDQVKKFYSIPGSGHFTQLMWWSADRVGCVRVHHPDNKLSWKFTLICNYLSTVSSSGNMKNNPIYEIGEKTCSNCPNKMKCEDKKYKNLCGKPEPIPDEAPWTGASSQQFLTANSIFVLVTIIILRVFY